MVSESNFFGNGEEEFVFKWCLVIVSVCVLICGCFFMMVNFLLVSLFGLSRIELGMLILFILCNGVDL